VIAHKNRLGKNLTILKREYDQPEEWDFFPETFMLPYEMHEFRSQFKPPQEEIQLKTEPSSDKKQLLK